MCKYRWMSDMNPSNLSLSPLNDFGGLSLSLAAFVVIGRVSMGASLIVGCTIVTLILVLGS